MGLYTIGFIILLVGIPACSGAYFMARYFGTSKTSAGAYLLVFAILACAALYLFEDTRLDPTDYTYALLSILIASLGLGAGLGVFFKRRSRE